MSIAAASGGRLVFSARTSSSISASLASIPSMVRVELAEAFAAAAPPSEITDQIRARILRDDL
jgi:hypothetical protein